METIQTKLWQMFRTVKHPDVGTVASKEGLQPWCQNFVKSEEGIKEDEQESGSQGGVSVTLDSSREKSNVEAGSTSLPLYRARNLLVPPRGEQSGYDSIPMTLDHELVPQRKDVNFHQETNLAAMAKKKAKTDLNVSLSTSESAVVEVVKDELSVGVVSPESAADANVWSKKIVHIAEVDENLSKIEKEPEVKLVGNAIMGQEVSCAGLLAADIATEEDSEVLLPLELRGSDESNCALGIEGASMSPAPPPENLINAVVMLPEEARPSVTAKEPEVERVDNAIRGAEVSCGGLLAADVATEEDSEVVQPLELRGSDESNCVHGIEGASMSPAPPAEDLINALVMLPEEAHPIVTEKEPEVERVENAIVGAELSCGGILAADVATEEDCEVLLPVELRESDESNCAPGIEGASTSPAPPAEDLINALVMLPEEAYPSVTEKEPEVERVGNAVMGAEVSEGGLLVADGTTEEDSEVLLPVERRESDESNCAPGIEGASMSPAPPPAANLINAFVMSREEAYPSFTEREPEMTHANVLPISRRKSKDEPHSPLSSISGRGSEQVETVKVVRPLEVRPVKTDEQLITALDMFRGEATHPDELQSNTVSKDIQALTMTEIAEEIHGEVPEKMMTALDMFSGVPMKLEDTKENDLGTLRGPVAAEKTLHLAAKLTNAFEGILSRVKREPVDDIEENAVVSAADVARRALLSEKTSEDIIRVKSELPNAVDNYQSGVFTDRKSFQALQFLSDSEDYSSGSDDTDDSSTDHEDGLSSMRVKNEPWDDEGALRICYRKRKNNDDLGNEKKHRNSNPGRRVQGGRLYDSSFGLTCHWCRQKTVELHVKCRECTIHYCGPCLLNRNGEKIKEELCDGVNWLCPKCRNGCGPGCENCCNCGPCRKADGKSPTGQLVWVARTAGFENVHDFLVHQETGETPEVIAKRKEGREWTNCGRFQREAASEDSEAGDVDYLDGEGEEFILDAETSTQLHYGKMGMKHVRRIVLSQKRKRGSTRGGLHGNIPAQHNGSTASFVSDEIILARMKISGQGHAAIRDFEARCAIKAAEERKVWKAEFDAKEHCRESETEEEDGVDTSLCKKEFEEGVEVAGCEIEGVDLEGCRAGKRLKTVVKIPEHVAGQSLGQEPNKTEPNTGGVSSGEAGMPGSIKVEFPNSLSEENLSSRASLIEPSTEFVDCQTINLLFNKESSNCIKQDPWIMDDREPTTTSPSFLVRKNYTSDRDIPSQGRSDSGSHSELSLRARGATVLGGPLGFSGFRRQSMSEQHGMGSPTDYQGKEYGMKLKAALADQFDLAQLEEMTELAECRKPLLRMRHMRGRSVDVATEDEGFSYLDHHPDFASRLAETTAPEEKWLLLRGFFFWLQHSCMEGAFKPWLPQAEIKAHSEGECVETGGPECQVTAVVVSLDGSKDVKNRQKRKYTRRKPLPDKSFRSLLQPLEGPSTLPQPDQMTNLLLLGPQKNTMSVRGPGQESADQAMKQRVGRQTTVQSSINYRVVLCLPAPAYCKAQMKANLNKSVWRQESV